MATNLVEFRVAAILNRPATGTFGKKPTMNIVWALLLFPVLMLALDLLTAPKHLDTAPRANLKDGRRAA